MKIGLRWVETDSGYAGFYRGIDPTDGRVMFEFLDGTGICRLPKDVFLSRWTLQTEPGCYECARVKKQRSAWT